MGTSRQTVSVAALLEGIAVAVPAQQQALDRNYRERLQDYTKLREQLGFESDDPLAQAIAPLPLTISESEVQVQVGFQSQREQKLNLGVRVLNLGYQRRFAHRELAASTLSAKIVRIPLHRGESDARAQAQASS